MGAKSDNVYVFATVGADIAKKGEQSKGGGIVGVNHFESLLLLFSPLARAVILRVRDKRLLQLAVLSR